jgi:hypothetical protein
MEITISLRKDYTGFLYFYIKNNQNLTRQKVIKLLLFKMYFFFFIIVNKLYLHTHYLILKSLRTTKSWI